MQTPNMIPVLHCNPHAIVWNRWLVFNCHNESAFDRDRSGATDESSFSQAGWLRIFAYVVKPNALARKLKSCLQKRSTRDSSQPSACTSYFISPKPSRLRETDGSKLHIVVRRNRPDVVSKGVDFGDVLVEGDPHL